MTWSTAVSMLMLIVSKMLLTLYDMVYYGVHVDCVQDVTLYDTLLIVYMLLTLYDYCGVHVDCVQDVTNIV